MTFVTPIKLVSFDIWLTLLKSNPHFKTARSALMAEALGYGDRVEEVIKASSLVDDEVDSITEQTGEDFDFEARFTRIATKLGVTKSFTSRSIEELEAKVGESFVELQPTLIESDILTTLARLKAQGVKIALLSNTGFVRGTTMRKGLDILGILAFADITLFSNELGIAKPHPKIFQALISTSGEKADSILHVGDNKENDYFGALRAGIKAALYSQKDVTEKDIATISKLSDLPELITKA